MRQGQHECAYHLDEGSGSNHVMARNRMNPENAEAEKIIQITRVEGSANEYSRSILHEKLKATYPTDT